MVSVPYQNRPSSSVCFFSLSLHRSPLLTAPRFFHADTLTGYSLMLIVDSAPFPKDRFRQSFPTQIWSLSLSNVSYDLYPPVTAIPFLPFPQFAPLALS